MIEQAYLWATRKLARETAKLEQRLFWRGKTAAERIADGLASDETDVPHARNRPR